RRRCVPQIEGRPVVDENAEAGREQVGGRVGGLLEGRPQQVAKELRPLLIRLRRLGRCKEAPPEGAGGPLLAGPEQCPFHPALVVLRPRQGQWHEQDATVVWELATAGLKFLWPVHVVLQEAMRDGVGRVAANEVMDLLDDVVCHLLQARFYLELFLVLANVP